MTALADIAALIRAKKSELLSKWRRDVRLLPGAENLDLPTLNDHIPTFIDELIDAMEAEADERVAEAHAGGSPSAHGLQRLEDGFDIAEVVAEYNILREALQDLVELHGLILQGRAARIVNRVLDEAIGVAVKTYAVQKAVELQQRREEHLAFVVHDLRPLSDASQTRVLNLVPKDFTVQADAALLTQVFQNLVSNALRYAPHGEVLLSARVAHSRVECSVEDDGEGIPPERLERIFDKLETDPDPEKSGTGLGLAIVKQTVEAHGGEVTVESRPDHGTIFRFTLPLPAGADAGNS